jgi:hypothetical protein
MRKNFMPFTAYTVENSVSAGVSNAAIKHFMALNVDVVRLGVLCFAPVQQVAVAIAKECGGIFVQVPFEDEDIHGYNTQDHEAWFTRRFRREDYFKKFDHMIFVGVTGMSSPFIRAFAPMNAVVAGQLSEHEVLLPGQAVTVVRLRSDSNHRPARLVFDEFFDYSAKAVKVA